MLSLCTIIITRDACGDVDKYVVHLLICEVLLPRQILGPAYIHSQRKKYNQKTTSYTLRYIHSLIVREKVHKHESL